MFSATWPFAIRDLAAKYLNNSVCLVIGEPERTINDSISQ
jgi:superfamily II DNA/RNA helicase